MPDLIVFRNRSRVIIIAESEQGRKHMKNNYIGADEYYNAPVDVMEDLIKDLTEAGLDVEVK